MAEQENDTGKKRSWANLPNGILSEVYSRVDVVDWVMFRSVCRSWKTTNALTIRPLQSRVPYLFLGKKRLYDPICDVTCPVDLLDKPGAIVNVAKDGWFLMTYNYKEIFFYNPITKATVQLPNFTHAHGLRSMCFSAPPTSKGWQVTFAKTDFDNHISVYVILDGEDEWRVRDFIPTTKSERSFKFSHSNGVIHKGLCYFLGKEGQLLVYNPKNHNFFFRKASKSVSQELKAYGSQEYMLESDGKLLAVFMNPDGSSIRIFRWDVWKKEWDMVENLGNNMLFVSAISSMSEKAEIKGMGNKIYFPRFMEDHGLFYSLSTKRYHTFEGGSYKSNDSKRFPDSIWVKHTE